ncbi:ABC-type bacteriocin/lantibiotic exporter, contains an N-terminal double-glycine peptidase domain [Ruminococcus albus]|uniref:ABC-type bacteriocin/lantibiotic exporter, contains an N-terminal double-glycine peptidase domain n=2 Tax=Ruminococcus albus TaxID=1264 RepID=A0A1H7GVI1_RUMAL|nr:ABC-type bacteriocin/lantibiotic exporter, contains an N-terminal double-glycine peptidase domain [Ruminococcus albus]
MRKVPFFKKYHIKTMISFFMKFKKYYFVSLFLTLISSIILYLAPLINILIFDKGLKNKDLKVLFFSVMLLLAANALTEIFNIMQMRFDMFLNYKMSKGLKTKILDYCIDNSFFADKSGEYVSLLERDASSYISLAYKESINFVRNIISAVSSMIIVIKLQPDLALVSVILQSMLIIVRLKTQGIEELKGKESRNSYIALHSAINEIVLNMKKISLLGAGSFAKKRYEKALDNEYKVTKSQTMFSSMIQSFISLTMNVVGGIILLWGGYKVILGTLTVGALISFNQYASSLSSPIIGLISIPSNFASKYDTINKISTILERKDTDPKINIDSISEIKVSKLSFSYDTEMIFHDAKAKFKKGHIYYICGQSGVGKSTLLQLISGQLRNYKGTIKYNDSNLQEIGTKNISDLVSVVMQESVLFNDTILNNIVLDQEIDLERIKYLCRICNILDDIEELPDKFDTIVSEKGDSFSGGQKSRLCLVRALYKNLPVLIIDEITAGLDGITERNIRENLSEVVSDKIVIIVTHSSNFIIDKSIIYNINDHKIKQGEPRCLK